MPWDNIQEKYIPKDNDFYRDHYHQVLIGVIGLFFLLLLVLVVVIYQMLHRPQPIFEARQPNGKVMVLRPYDEPNLLPDTILRFASKAATMAYTYSYVNYKAQAASARHYFTADGWQDFGTSLNHLLDRVVANQLFVNGVVSGTPVISNQGPFPGKGYVWRVQIPFLVTYQSANSQVQQAFHVILTIVRVPTYVNPQGIGIDQFVMV